MNALRALACLLVLGACSPRLVPSGPRLVVLFATCSLNKDFLGPYAAGIPYTPHLDALAKDALVFERHVTEAPVSGIAYASLFTGSQADRHGIFHHPSKLPDECLTIFEAFAAAGYETHYFNGHELVSADLNYAQGVAPEHVYPSQDHKRALLSSKDKNFGALLARLQADPDLHALVVVNFSVTHAAYTAQIKPKEFAAFLERHPRITQGVTLDDWLRLAPIYEQSRLPLQWDYANAVTKAGLSAADEKLLARFLEVVYTADVELLDSMVGQALDSLRTSGLDADTLFAFTADHGEYLFHQERLFQWGHGLQLAPEELDVPWILRPARAAFAPGRYAEITRSIDVFPTLAGLCGVPLPPGAPVDGTNLAPAILGRAPPPVQTAFSHDKVLDERLMQEFADLALVRQYFPSTDPGLMWVSLRERDRFVRMRNTGDGTFVCEAFDLVQDPLAFHGQPATAKEERELGEYKARLVASSGRDRGVDAETIDRDLRALGYVR